MAKKKSKKPSDQAELPLGDAETAPSSKRKAISDKPADGRGSDPRPDSPPASVSKSAELKADSLPLKAAAAEPEAPPPKRKKGQKVQDEPAPLAQAYRNWFLDYASYVILDRAVPHLDDGLKPVQRRVLHTLWDMDDGRFHKVANVVGATMKLHPHGDASIGAALVGIAQRGWLIEPQGNFGNVLTGDDAAAPRYIEARLTPFARDVLFNPKTTTWQASYDGRTKEPVTLPAKFPVVLLEGADGIAVGLATKILPHNFNDLCRAAINHLQGKTFRILPDFPTGGTADFSEYNDGERGGKVKVRAKIEERSKYVLAVTELPYGVTTESLIESILAANAKGKIKIKHVDDNTADKVEILIHLPQGSEPDKVVQQLYVFTSCQVQLNPAACVIVRDAKTGDDKPVFMGVRDILKASAEATRELLKRELEIKLGELEQQWHWDSLERIFIEERIYRNIEKSKTWESVMKEIRDGLKPFLRQLRREVTDDDITRLTEIRIKRISAYNRFQADEAIKKIEEGIKETKANLRKLTDYAVAWFEQLAEKHQRDDADGGLEIQMLVESEQHHCGAVEIRHAGAERDQHIHVGAAAAQRVVRAGVEPRADPELHRCRHQQLQRRRKPGVAVTGEHRQHQRDKGQRQHDGHREQPQVAPVGGETLGLARGVTIGGGHLRVVAGLADRADQLIRRDPARWIFDVGFFGGEVDPRSDVGQAVQRFFDARGAGRAGHAGDRQIDDRVFRECGERIHPGSSLGCSAPIIYPSGVYRKPGARPGFEAVCG